MRFSEIVAFTALALNAAAGEIAVREELVAQADGQLLLITTVELLMVMLCPPLAGVETDWRAVTLL